MKNLAKRQKKFAIFNIIIIFTIFIFYNISFRNNEVIALSKYGSSGSEVREIQTKLKRWGYYSGNIDGVYGSKTVGYAAEGRKESRGNGLRYPVPHKCEGLLF